MARTQLNFRLNEDQKDRWEQHAKESRYDDHVSDLVKRAVENQIDRETGEASDSTEGGIDNSGEVLDRIQDLQNNIQDLEGEISQALDAVHGQEGIDPDLPPEIHAVLPLGKENAWSAEEIADAAHLSESEVRFTLENLVRNMGDVKRIPEGVPGPTEEVRWYKVE